MNPLQPDFKYPTDFGFREKCRIPSDSDLESVTPVDNDDNNKGISVFIQATHCS